MKEILKEFDFQKIFTDLAEGIRGVDVVYMTRIQKERFVSLEEYEKVKNNFVLTQKLLNQVSHLQKLTRKGNFLKNII